MQPGYEVFCSDVKLCPTLCDPMACGTPGFPVPQYLLALAQVHVHCIGDAMQPCYPLSPFSPSVCSLSQHQGHFQRVRSSVRWPKYWNFSFSISPSNEYSRLISFRMDWFDLFGVQGTLTHI